MVDVLVVVALVGLGLVTNGRGLNRIGVEGRSVVDDTVELKSGLAVESGVPVLMTPSWDGSWMTTPNVSFSFSSGFVVCSSWRYSVGFSVSVVSLVSVEGRLLIIVVYLDKKRKFFYLKFNVCTYVKNESVKYFFERITIMLLI